MEKGRHFAACTRGFEREAQTHSYRLQVKLQQFYFILWYFSMLYLSMEIDCTSAYNKTKSQTGDWWNCSHSTIKNVLKPSASELPIQLNKPTGQWTRSDCPVLCEQCVVLCPDRQTLWWSCACCAHQMKGKIKASVMKHKPSHPNTEMMGVCLAQ